MLERAGEHTVVLERAEVGAAWAARYDRLQLHTVRWLSGLPGYPIPRAFGKWPSRERVGEYLQRYADHHRLDVRTGIDVARVERAAEGWTVRTSSGPMAAERVVVATGQSNVPFVPKWPGTFSGEIVHSAEYRNPSAYRGSRVLVVGSGNSGAEIAVDLAEGGAKRGAALGADAAGHRAARHARRPEPAARYRQHAPPDRCRRPARGRHSPRCDPGPCAVRAGRATAPLFRVPRPESDPDRGRRARGRGAEWARPCRACARTVRRWHRGACRRQRDRDRRRHRRDRLSHRSRGLVGHLGVLDERGRPLVRDVREPPGAPGLHFVGYEVTLGGTLRLAGVEARQLARTVAAARAGEPASS